MTERQGSKTQRLIPLWKAAAVAHKQLFPGDSNLQTRGLNATALALFKLMPVYARDPEDGLTELTEADLDAGRFIFDAQTLECRDRRASKVELLVCPVDLDRALNTLQLQPLKDARTALALQQQLSAGVTR